MYQLELFQVQSYSHRFDLTVSFESKTLDGTVVYDLKNLDNASEVILDTSALNIKSTKVNGKEVSFELKPVTPIYGHH